MLTLFGIIFVLFSVAQAHVNDGSFTSEIMRTITSLLTSSVGISNTCKEHLQELLAGVINKKVWALQMIDSMTKFPEGILEGRMKIPGFFDECVNAANEKFRGKHCMPKLSLKSEAKTPLSHIYSQMSRTQSGMKIAYGYGICIPFTCNSTDVLSAFRLASDSFEHLKQIEMNITENDCSTKEWRPFRTEDWVTVAVLIVLVIIALGSTAYDLVERFKRKQNPPNKLWSSFSFYTNGKYLFTISQSTSQLKCLHGMRCLSIFWVILGHSYFSLLLSSPINMTEIPKSMKDKSFVPVSNAFVSVDSFFFLSGLLVCLVFFRDISKKKTFDVPVAFIHRYMRLTPPFALLMLLQSTIISRIGNGPFWNECFDNIEKQCRESWWTGLLYLQNYLKPLSMCIGQAWYLSADMQMYWVSPLILYPMLWFPSFAPFFITILVLAAAFMNFVVAYVNNLSPTFLMNWGTMTVKQFEMEYAPSHTRMAPWLIGSATGYIICAMQTKKIRIKLSKLWVAVGWLMALGLLAVSLLGIIRFVGKQSNEYTQLESSMYLAFHRVGWALGMGWVVIACAAGYGGPINSFLSLDIFQPIAKLSYCNFLLNVTFQKYRIYSSRRSPYLRHFDIVHAFFGDLLICNLISIPVILLFEIPFSNLERYFLQDLVIFPLPKPSQVVEKRRKRTEGKKSN